MKRFTTMRTAKIAAAVVAPALLMIWYLSFVHKWRSPYLLYLFLAFLLISLSPNLCADPVAENEAARTRRGNGFFYLIAAGIGIAYGLVVPWLLGRPEVESFLSNLKPWLRDWKPTTVVALLCLQLMRVGLRKALAFKVTDLYPHLRRTEKTEA